MLLAVWQVDDTNHLSLQPLSRFFHAAALVKDTMVIVGGRTGEEDYSNTVSLYQINCNTWIQPGIMSGYSILIMHLVTLVCAY